ncbi:flagellar export protein FliJ [Curvivirga sp.]|uniref:flagellar export protein FliJ n=1 Tax=Curvivirga sp. TaxID=2856848 RepID=UPI003B5BD614
MKSTLDTLIRLAEFTVDERRRELKEIQDREDVFLQAKVRLAERVETEKVSAQQSTEGTFAYGQFVAWAKIERERLDQAIADIQPELEEARAQLSEAFAEQKKVEITKERKDEEEREEIKAKEQAFLDEFTTSQHIRKQKEKK